MFILPFRLYIFSVLLLGIKCFSLNSIVILGQIKKCTFTLWSLKTRIFTWCVPTIFEQTFVLVVHWRKWMIICSKTNWTLHIKCTKIHSINIISFFVFLNPGNFEKIVQFRYTLENIVRAFNEYHYHVYTKRLPGCHVEYEQDESLNETCMAFRYICIVLLTQVIYYPHDRKCKNQCKK